MKCHKHTFLYPQKHTTFCSDIPAENTVPVIFNPHKYGLKYIWVGIFGWALNGVQSKNNPFQSINLLVGEKAGSCMYSNELTRCRVAETNRWQRWRTVTGRGRRMAAGERDWRRRWAGETNLVSDEQHATLNFQILK